MEPRIDLLGCEYLGGCPALGDGVRNKVELHFDADGLMVAVAPNGLFAVAPAHPVLTLGWPEITALRVSTTPAEDRGLLRRVARRAANVWRTRLDLDDELTVSTRGWAMALGVRARPDELAESLRHLLELADQPTSTVTVG